MLLIQKCTEIFFQESKNVNKVITKINGHIDSVLDNNKYLL